jgi:tetratricopeptide (TPR) repeat protein
LEVLGRAAQIPGLAARIAATVAIARGEILDASSRREEAAQALHGGRHLAEEIGAADLLGRALVAQAQLHHSQGDERRAALVADEALELLEQRPADPSLPQALLIAANGHRLGARPEQAAQIFQRCLDVATQQGNPGAVASARGGLGALYAEEGQLEDALALLEQESLWLRTAGLSHRMVPTLYRQAIAWRRLGRCDRSLACLEEAEDICRYASIPYDRALVRVGQASVHLVNGDIEGSGRWLEQARMALDGEASVFLRLAWREIQAALRLAHGDRQAALAAYHAAESEAQRAGYASASSFFLGMIGVLTADAESITQAMDVLSTAGDRRLAALLLLQGAVIGGDPEVLGSAEQEARDSGDIYLLLDVLHASGGASHQQEASDLARAILRHLPIPLRSFFQALPAVRWALSEPPSRLRRA